jgi:hypothetical protein
MAAIVCKPDANAAPVSTVMPGLVPGIHVFAEKKGMDGRDKPGHYDF